MGNIFYCYSYKLSLFLRAMDFKYIEIGHELKTGNRYWAFPKSEQLDLAIETFNSIKLKFSR